MAKNSRLWSARKASAKRKPNALALVWEESSLGAKHRAFFLGDLFGQVNYMQDNPEMWFCSFPDCTHNKTVYGKLSDAKAYIEGLHALSLGD